MENEKIPLNNEILNYIAGAFDFRASLYITRYTHDRSYLRYQCGIELPDKNKEILLYIQSYVGGNFLAIQPEKNKTTFRLCWRNYQVSNVLNILKPFLKIKLNHANILLKFRDSFNLPQSRKRIIGMPELPPEILSIRSSCYNEIKKLNMNTENKL